jgi:catechol 2,3-dioxygenase-like lactoylglutathione lyase family enzyme
VNTHRRTGKGESRTVEPRLNVITLAVDDLERALVFYRDGLGLQTNGVVASDLVDQKTGAAGAIVIFKLESAAYRTRQGRGSTRRPTAERRIQPRSTGREPRRRRQDSRTGRCRRRGRDAAP